MNNLKIKKKIINLRKKINKYSNNYLNKDKSLITDKKYDFLFQKLINLENKYPIFKTNNSPTQIINYKFNKYKKKEKHIFPMLSIKSVYNFKKIKYFIKKINKIYNKKKFCCELKIDGIAISLIYKKNKLYKSITKGNGIYGENITNEIKVISSIPKKIINNNKKNKIEIRGELFINKKNFIKIKKKEKSFSNCRNLTSGTIRLLNKNLIKKRKLSFIAYDIIINNNRNNIKSHINCLKKINKLGFKIDKYTKKCNSINKIKIFYEKIKKIKKKLKFNIDGIVIKINNRKLQEKLKFNNNYINWAIAIKFDSKTKKTSIINIKFKIGKSGIVIPIIIIKPVYINKVKIKKINLYNLKYLKKLNINIKDKILIERKGDVIPKIKKVLKIYNTNNINYIKKCPYCKTNIDLNKNIPKCINNNCKQKKIKKIKNFISKNGFNIKFIGNKTIKILIKNKLINNIQDIFKLKINSLIKLNNFNYKKSEKIIKSIKYSIKNIKFINFIYSLSIPNIGLSSAKYIYKKFKNINNHLDKKNYTKIINKLNSLQIKSIKNFFNNKKNINNIKKILLIIKKNNFKFYNNYSTLIKLLFYLK